MKQEKENRPTKGEQTSINYERGGTEEVQKEGVVKPNAGAQTEVLGYAEREG